MPIDKQERKTLRQIYTHPDATDTRWIDVERLFIALGGYARWSDKHHLTVELHGHKASFDTPRDKGGRLGREDGVKVMAFLRSAGVTADMANGDE